MARKACILRNNLQLSTLRNTPVSDILVWSDLYGLSAFKPDAKSSTKLMPGLMLSTMPGPVPNLLILYRLDTRIAHIRVVSVVYFDFPSMKRAENVDGKFKNRLSSMKRAEIVDGKFNILHRLDTLPHVSVPRQVPILIPSQLPDLKPDLLQKMTSRP